tara:strand:- start:1619 stop:2026 length:408 start_codon:yes stop_codon:yes gene_type:complete
MKRKTDYSKYHSFIEDGQKYLQCCRCMKHRPVDMDTAKVTCSRCVVIIDMAKFPDTLPKSYHRKSTGRPAGWHWMNEFVDKDGNVFHKGKEQPELKGTLPPTKVKPPKKRKKLTKDEKLYKRINDWKKRKKKRKQ